MTNTARRSESRKMYRFKGCFDNSMYRLPPENTPDSFSEGLKMANTKGALIIPVRLTKHRAQILLSLVHRYRHEYNVEHQEDDYSANEMQSAMQWIVNQINKRWSQNDLYSPRRKKRTDL